MSQVKTKHLSIINRHLAPQEMSYSPAKNTPTLAPPTTPMPWY